MVLFLHPTETWTAPETLIFHLDWGKSTPQRESLEVLKELASGASNREIADHLMIAENTVKSHVRNVLTKLNLRNRREATAFAHSQGLLYSLNHPQTNSN